MHDKKCVIVVDGALPIGLIANASAVMGVSIGHLFPEVLGADTKDKSGQNHRGITAIVLPILKADAKKISELFAVTKNDTDIVAMDFSDIAQRTRDYADYTSQLAVTNPEELRYASIALYGDAKKIKSLTGSLPLLR